MAEETIKEKLDRADALQIEIGKEPDAVLQAAVEYVTALNATNPAVVMTVTRRSAGVLRFEGRAAYPRE